MTVVTFEDYQPSPRYDGIAWKDALIYEAPASDGPWTQIDSIDLSFLQGGLDSDPTAPKTRDFTTSNATLVNGWYRVTFSDPATGLGLPTQPVYNGPKLEYLPAVDQVARKILSRTRDKFGNNVNTFNEETLPEGDQVQAIIDDISTETADVIGDDIPNSLIDDAQNVVALRAAMQVELDYYSDQVNTNRSVYPQLKDQYESALAALQAAVANTSTDGPVTSTTPGTKPRFSFPSTPPVYGLNTRW